MSSVNAQKLSEALKRLLRLARAHAGILLVLATALAHRIWFLRWWRAFPGGDTYNFILIAQELLRSSYPIAEKRLPVYPTLIAIAHAVLDWETAALAVSLTASLVAILLLYAIGRSIGLSKTALVIGLLPFQAISPFLFQSIRGYADTTFVALMLGTLLAFIRARTHRGALVGGVLLGAASLTRPEGIVLVPVMLGAWLTKKLRRRAMIAALPVVACWGLFLLLSARAGRPLLPQEYLADAAVTAFGVRSPREFTANYAALWTSVGFDRLWNEPKRLARDVADAAQGSFTPRRVGSFFTDPKEFPSLLLLAGLPFLVRSKRRGIFMLILVSYAIIALPIAWWGVRQRFLIVLYPLPFLVLAAGADALLHGVRRLSERLSARTPALARGITVGTGLTLLALSFGPWTKHTAAEAREVQEKNWGKDYAYYQAIQEARRLPGRIAFEHRSSIALALFGEPDRGRGIFADTHLNTPSATEQWDALEKWQVGYIVIRDEASGAFPILTDPAFTDRFVVHRTFQHPQARGAPDEATIYGVRR